MRASAAPSLAAFSLISGSASPGGEGSLLGRFWGAILSIPGSFYPLMPNVHAFATFLAIFLLAGACTGTAATAAVAVLIPNEVRGITAALFGSVSIIASYGIAPLLVEHLSKSHGVGYQHRHSPDDHRVPHERARQRCLHRRHARCLQSSAPRTRDSKHSGRFRCSQVIEIGLVVCPLTR